MQYQVITIVVAEIDTRTSNAVNREEKQPHNNIEIILVPGNEMSDKPSTCMVNILGNGKPRWV